VFFIWEASRVVKELEGIQALLREIREGAALLDFRILVEMTAAYGTKALRTLLFS
jgi:hypothetical protein